eukprot:176361_1
MDQKTIHNQSYRLKNNKKSHNRHHHTQETMEEAILPQMISFEDAPQTNEHEASKHQIKEVASPKAILPPQISPEVHGNAVVTQPEVPQDEEPLPPNIHEDIPPLNVHESTMVDQTQQQEQCKLNQLTQASIG